MYYRLGMYPYHIINKPPTIEKMIVKNKMVKLIKSELSKNGFKFNSKTMKGVNKEFGEYITFTFNPKGKLTYMEYDNGWILMSGKVTDITSALQKVIEISNEYRNDCK